MAGRDAERRKLLDRLRARRTALAQATIDAARAETGTPPDWPAGQVGSRQAGGASRLAGGTEAGTGRLIIRETDEGLVIHNPSARSWAVVAALVAWLSIWSMGEAFALREIVQAPFVVVLFLLVWLAIWTIAGIVVTGIVLWQLFGNERLFVVGGAVTRETNIGPFRFRRDWLPGQAGDFAIANSGTHSPGKDRITFRAGRGRRSFAAGVHRTELETALAAIRRHLAPPGGDAPAHGT